MMSYRVEPGSFGHGLLRIGSTYEPATGLTFAVFRDIVDGTYWCQDPDDSAWCPYCGTWSDIR